MRTDLGDLPLKSTIQNFVRPVGPENHLSRIFSKFWKPMWFSKWNFFEKEEELRQFSEPTQKTETNGSHKKWEPPNTGRLGPWPIEPHDTLKLDETMGKPMGRGSRVFVHSVSSIWTKRMDHMIFLNANLFCLIFFWKCVCPNSLFISYFFSFFSLPFQVSSLIFYFFIFFSLCTFHKQPHIKDARKKWILFVISMHWCLYMFIQQVINIKRQQFYKEPPKNCLQFYLSKK